MRAIRKFVYLIGVTLSVVPIFSVAWAQQSNQQVNMLMEIQALRAEIAELRDMIERQQHQLSQLQSASQTPHSTGIAGQTPSAASVSSTADTAANEPNLDALPPSQQSQPAAPDAAIAEQELVPAVAEDGSDLSPPEAQTDDADISSVDDVVIEERVIEQNPAEAMPNLATDYPPVEERDVIGSVPATEPQPESVVTEDGGLQQSTSSSPAQAIPQVLPSTQSTTPSTTGVIVVPMEQDSNHQQAYPGQQGSSPTTDPTTDQVAPPATQSGTTANPLYRQPNQTVANPIESSQPVLNSSTNTAVRSEQDYYQQGFELLKQSEHTQAVALFKQQISSYPQGDLADDAHYWIAESMYVNRSLDNSKQYFKAIIDNFGQSPRLPDAMLKTAYIEQEQGNLIEARILLQEITQFHPRSNAAISAKNRLAELD